MSIYQRTVTNGRQFLVSQAEAPSAASTAYLFKTEKKTSQKLFNTVNTQLRAVTISGMQILLDGILDVNGARDIESLTLIADEIVINRPLALPGTNLII